MPSDGPKAPTARCEVTTRTGADVAPGAVRPRSLPPDAVRVSCVRRALARENLMTAAQAKKQQMRLRYPEYYASPVLSTANVSVSDNSRP